MVSKGRKRCQYYGIQRSLALTENNARNRLNLIMLQHWHNPIMQSGAPKIVLKFV